MKRRPCQYCAAPLPWYAPLVHFYTCTNCAYRMQHGGWPRKPPAPELPAATAQPEADG